jgi:serine phosphatase RsbU (regulator of sigma subunit)
VVLFYTDALIEARDGMGRMLGEGGLLKLAAGLRRQGAGDMGRALLAAVDRYRGGAAADDDVTMLALYHNAGPRRQPGLLETLGVYAKVLGLKKV